MIRSRARTWLVALAMALPVVLVAALGGLALGVARAAPQPYTKQTLHFEVQVGPNRSTTCDIVGDLYLPRSASRTDRVPAILTTHGFGGSKDDQAGIGEGFASRGYAVLAYSGLGFGGSDCKITLDDRDFDGAAASQLIGYLGGAPGIAFTDAGHTSPAPTLQVVQRDRTDHEGRHARHDPRVGMIGGSYGGEIQFAAASVDPRLDTIVPVITWNDLSYSLAPNNTTTDYPGVSAATPGAAKLVWAAGFSALGVADGVRGLAGDPTRVVGCPNFADYVCPALATAGSTGYLQPGDVGHLRHASVSTYTDQVRVPTLLLQGEKDTLFNLNEAAATYTALKEQGTPVRMIWQSWGHSDLDPAPGEINLDDPDPSEQYETARVVAWFAHWLKGDRSAPLGPAFTWFRDWVDYQGIATPAYAESSSYPVGSPRTWYLSAERLVTDTEDVEDGSQQFTTPPAGAPNGLTLDRADVIGSYFSGDYAVPDQEVPGTSATWTSAALTDPLEVVGSPTAHLQVRADLTALTGQLGQTGPRSGPAGDLVLFLQVLDVDPSGKAHPIQGEIAPVRVPDASTPFTVHLPAIVHRFPPGHRIAFKVAGGSVNYRGNLVGVPVTVASGTDQTLTLPATTGERTTTLPSYTPPQRGRPGPADGRDRSHPGTTRDQDQQGQPGQ